MEVCISAIETEIVDIPTVRKHLLSSLSIQNQTFVIVRTFLSDGTMGIGEGTTLGGPVWSEESPESIQITIDKYFRPYLLNQPVHDFTYLARLLSKAAKRNYAAKAAVFMAILDAVGKSIEVPVHELLGRARTTSFPVLWALASGEPEQEIEEALQKINKGQHREFKVKIGINPPKEDLQRLIKIADGIDGKGRLKVIDANQAWDLETARKYIPAFEELGIEVLEQPLPRWDRTGMKELTRYSQLSIMADESIFDIHEAEVWFNTCSVNSISLKLVKHANPFHMQSIAKVAHSNQIALYGGTLLESAIGTAAHLHTFSTLPELSLGTESFGPMILEADLSKKPIIYQDFEVLLPEGYGLGVELNEDVVSEFKRT